MRFILGVCVFLKPTCSVWSDDSFAQNIPSLAFMRSACPSCFSTHAPRPRPSFLSGIFGLWSNGAGIRIVCRAAPHAAFGRTDVAEGGVRGPRPRLYLSSNALQREWCTSGGYRGLADPSVYMLRMLPRGECLPVREGVKPSRRRAQTGSSKHGLQAFCCCIREKYAPTQSTYVSLLSDIFPCMCVSVGV